MNVTDAIARQAAAGVEPPDPDKASDATPGAGLWPALHGEFRRWQAAPDGRRLAFVTEAISQRSEKVGESEIYSVDLNAASPDQPPRQVTHNEAIEQDIRWSNDSRQSCFRSTMVPSKGNTRIRRLRLYWVDADNGRSSAMGGRFRRPVAHYAVTSDGGVVAASRLGTEVQVYSQARPGAAFSHQPGLAGHLRIWWARLHKSARIAFVHSALETPAEVYLADSAGGSRPHGPLPHSTSYLRRTRSAPGQTLSMESRGRHHGRRNADLSAGKVRSEESSACSCSSTAVLPTLTAITSRPIGMSGIAWRPTQGWLVFEPNYRGSTGYGDKFLMRSCRKLSRVPARIFCKGVDALVKDGIADPDHLAVGGYSYGGYMTNWLITQTTRFKAAVTGAGAVENVANWGNDDTDLRRRLHPRRPALGGAAALQQRSGDFPDRQGEDADPHGGRRQTISGWRCWRIICWIMRCILLNIPSTLLIFPGEGHSLDKNPWHGKIKVREELKWLQKYGGNFRRDTAGSLKRRWNGAYKPLGLREALARFIVMIRWQRIARCLCTSPSAIFWR